MSQRVWKTCLLGIVLGASSGLGAENSVFGTVLAREGKRTVVIPRARVIAREVSGGEVLAVTKSDDRGRYRITDLPNPRFALTVRRNGYYTHSAGGHEGEQVVLDCSRPEDCAQVDFELAPTAVITGRVIDELGEPLSDVGVSARLSLASGQRGPGRSFGESTDDRGMFRIAGLAPGQYSLHTQARRSPFSGRRTMEGQPLEVEVEAGDIVEGIQLVLVPAPVQRFEVSGRVTGIDLSEKGFHFVAIRRRRGSQSRSLSEDGKFSFGNLAPGRYTFAYSRFDNPYERRRARQRPLGAAEVDRDLSGLVLRPLPPTGFRGKLTFEFSAPEADISLVFHSEDGTPYYVTQVTSPDFEFEATDLGPGTYSVETRRRRNDETPFYVKGVRRGSELTPARDLRLVRGRVDTIEVVLGNEFATVHGRVKQPRDTDEVRKGAQYRVGLKGPYGVRAVQADQYGRFAFERVLPGEYQICAWANLDARQVRDDAAWEAAGAAVRTFPVEAGSDIEIDLTAAR